ncbi:MAG: KpsF/GutQ family sugar-phosphate isomerase [Planctomycetes bacterium]|nr:KpsF/GutQ family sugar-phosphate isomerase [Planctomycetota bacterium]
MLDYARGVIAAEAEAVRSLGGRLDARFEEAVRLVLACAGRVVVTGMGKAGIIGEKIAATLASTGTPAHTIHPAEAAHGDLGRVTPDDVVLILSNSGESEEVVRLLPLLRRIGVKIVALTGAGGSTVARNADVVLDIGPIAEACPLGLAPSASTTAMLAMGDALALTVQKERKFTPEEYAFYHPAGALGRRLLKVEEVMRTGSAFCVVEEEATLRDALVAISRTTSRAGAVTVRGPDGRLAGIFTDGDLRRLLGASRAEGLLERPIRAVMTRDPRRITVGRLASEAGYLLKQYRIDEVPVVDGDRRPVGLIDVQDLLAIGLV